MVFTLKAEGTVSVFYTFASCMYSVLKNVVMYIHVVSHYLGFYYKGAFPLGSQHALLGVHMQSVQDMLLLHPLLTAKHKLSYTHNFHTYTIVITSSTIVLYS